MQTGGRVAMSQMSTGLSRQEKRTIPSLSLLPFAVPPLEAARLLSLSTTRIYELMRVGRLISYRDGRARRITMASIRAYIARRLAANAGEWHPLNPQPPQRRKVRK